MGILGALFGGKKSKTTSAEVKSPADVYLGLRSKALTVQPEMIGVPADGSLLAILMETVQSGAVVTLVGMADGTTSLYFSNGGGIIGSGQHEPVAVATKAWLARAAAEFASSMTATTEFPLPAPGQARFYLVYADRVLTAEAVENHLGYNRHPLSLLFHEGHKVINQVRLHSPRR